MAKHKKAPKKREALALSKPNDELKQLRKENQMLKIENEFLKKPDALARKKSAQKNSRD
nr:hypothetical protein [Levilactobacillus brevis]